MTYFADLTTCTYFGTDLPLVAVGWLDEHHPFATGRVADAEYLAILRLAANPWEPFAVAGLHRCPFCVFTGGPAQVRVADVCAAVGATNIFVPSAAAVFVAPSMIVHYMDAHQYRPPDEFCDAVRKSPPMRSFEYLRAMRQHRIDKTQGSR